MTTNNNGSKWLRKEKRLAIYMRDNWRCVYCDRDLRRAKPRMRTLDHIIPRHADGSSNDASNLVTACKKCNDLKNGKHVQDFCKYNREALQRIIITIVKPLNVKLAKQILAGEIDNKEYPK